ncbi:MAG: 23S rRNA (pseudouridine(1915)-N(3))-methyltransferase RlmH [Bacillota bacterium]
MNYKIYIIGDKIDKFCSEAIKEYEKRLSLYCKIQLIQVKTVELLQKILSDKTHKILISTSGELISSEALSIKINSLAVSGKSDVSVIIGAENIPHDEKMAISPMEIDLGLLATIVFEQIYRGYRILNNQAYHK